jgi:hypothetical protein
MATARIEHLLAHGPWPQYSTATMGRGAILSMGPWVGERSREHVHLGLALYPPLPLPQTLPQTLPLPLLLPLLLPLPLALALALALPYP